MSNSQVIANSMFLNFKVPEILYLTQCFVSSFILTYLPPY
jgi:hypothetical protein